MTTHRQKHPLYRLWRNMLNRCNPAIGRDNYAGRGITVCDRWKDFDTFVADVGPRPSPEHTIDRRDNDGNYEPGNVRWATPTQQGINRKVRRDSKSGVPGVMWDKRRRKWRAEIKCHGKRSSLGYFDDIDAAVAVRRKAEVEREQAVNGTATP